MYKANSLLPHSAFYRNFSNELSKPWLKWTFSQRWPSSRNAACLINRFSTIWLLINSRVRTITIIIIIRKYLRAMRKWKIKIDWKVKGEKQSGKCEAHTTSEAPNCYTYSLTRENVWKECDILRKVGQTFLEDNNGLHIQRTFLCICILMYA